MAPPPARRRERGLRRAGARLRAEERGAEPGPPGRPMAFCPSAFLPVFLSDALAPVAGIREVRDILDSS